LLACFDFLYTCIKKLIEKGESNEPKMATSPQNHSSGNHPDLCQSEPFGQLTLIFAIG
jgi:hypothetical protein